LASIGISGLLRKMFTINISHFKLHFVDSTFSAEKADCVFLISSFPPPLAHVNGLCCLLFIAEHKANLLFRAQMMIRSDEERGKEREKKRAREEERMRGTY